MILVFLWSYLILLKRANKAILGVRSSMIKERSKSLWKGRLKKRKNHPAISPEYRDVQWPPAPWPGEREGWRDNQLYCLPAGGESHLKLKHGPFFKIWSWQQLHHVPYETMVWRINDHLQWQLGWGRWQPGRPLRPRERWSHARNWDGFVFNSLQWKRTDSPVRKNHCYNLPWLSAQSCKPTSHLSTNKIKSL